MTTLIGARPEDWQHFDLILGLGDNLLPVVPDPLATPTAGSKVKKFGKIPSMYDGEGRAYGILTWTQLSITSGNLEHWLNDRRYSMCLRLGPKSGVYAIDVDVDDFELCAEIDDIIARSSNEPALPRRSRAGALKHLLLFQCVEPISKIIIDWGLKDSQGKPERIEILGDGQQCVVAGSHPSGVLYQWDGESNLPWIIPTLGSTQFESLVKALSAFAEREAVKLGTSSSVTGVKADGQHTAAQDANGEEVLSSISPMEMGDLREALIYQPLVDSAASNDVWSEIGYALLSLGSTGQELFEWFSMAAPNQENADDPQTWWQAHENQSPRSDYRHIFSLAKALGWRSISNPERFPVVTGDSREGGDGLPGPVEPLAGAATAEVPIAQDLCTDLANARRIQNAFQSKLRCIAGIFYVYDGKRWVQNDSEAMRCAALLSSIIRQEADEAFRNFEIVAVVAPDLVKQYRDHPRRDQCPAKRDLLQLPDGKKIIQWLELAERLRKWMKTSEDMARINAAIGGVKKMLTLDTAVLDAHPYLLNVQNGTIDLRTGQLRPHDPADWITHIAPTDYLPGSTCPNFERFLVEVLDDERARFLQRWFGYCATGETREQKVVLHIGGGGNGKGTIFRLLHHVLGSYVHDAAPNLLTGTGSDRHPTEIADLFGRRCVVSQESDEGAVLREGFLKRASGEDMMSGRWMFKDFFSFMPTFKLQLLTNHKPIIKGQDFGVWRRLLLVDYAHKYGSAEEVARGEATRVGDMDLTMKLMAERQGILTWIVKGAKEWYNFKLRPPASVVEASLAYRDEQDRVREFVADRCIVDRTAWSAFSGPFGLYPEYVRWCKDSGFQTLTITRFIAELKRVTPNFRREEKRSKIDNVWKSFKGCWGLRINTDQDGGGRVDESFEDLI